MRHRIDRVAGIFSVLLAFIALAFGYWQVVQASDLQTRSDNPRRADAELRTARGRILDRNGKVLAYSERSADGYYRRIYTEPSLTPVVGFVSNQLGNTGIEAAMDSELRGSGPADPISRFAGWVTRRDAAGEDVVLTIDLDIHRKAVASLEGRPGSVAAIDPRNGEILALVSTPFVDANQLVFNPAAPRWSVESQRVETFWRTVRSDPNGPLLNRATQGLYVPGSTYKTVTLAASLERGVATPQTAFPIKLNAPDAAHSGWWHEDNHVTCQNHTHNETQETLAGAYAWSCNVIFAGLAMQLGPDNFTDVSRRFGVGERPPVEIVAETSRVQVDQQFLYGPNRESALAETGMGQGQLEMTPLQMALIAAAPAANGQIFSPHLVKEVRRADGSVLSRTTPKVWKQAVSSKTAADLRSIMAYGVETGWANAAASKLLAIGGKTGTAETGFSSRPPHSWFIGFAPVDNPTMAIAVVEPFAGGGSAFASPAARTVLEQTKP